MSDLRNAEFVVSGVDSAVAVGQACSVTCTVQTTECAMLAGARPPPAHTPLRCAATNFISTSIFLYVPAFPCGTLRSDDRAQYTLKFKDLPAGVTVEPAESEQDKAVIKAKSVSFTVQVTPSAAGEHTLVAAFAFCVCEGDESCDMQEADCTFTLKAE